MAKIVRQARAYARVLAVMLAVIATLAAPIAAPSAHAQLLPPPPPPIDPTWGFGLPGLPFPGFGLPPGISPLGAPWVLPSPMTTPPPPPAGRNCRRS
jgi:hypothetical protein